MYECLPIHDAKLEGRKEGAQQQAVENAIVLINKYNATPEEASEQMGAPLDKLLIALKLQNENS